MVLGWVVGCGWGVGEGVCRDRQKKGWAENIKDLTNQKSSALLQKAQNKRDGGRCLCSIAQVLPTTDQAKKMNGMEWKIYRVI